jgi:hypothetical protein
MFQSKGRWVGYLPGVGKKAFATKEEAETYENGTEKLSELQESDKVDWRAKVNGSKEEEENSKEEETSSNE